MVNLAVGKRRALETKWASKIPSQFRTWEARATAAYSVTGRGGVGGGMAVALRRVLVKWLDVASLSDL